MVNHIFTKSSSSSSIKVILYMKMMVAMAFVFTSNTSVRTMQNLSHQMLKSKQGLFSIFWGIFAFETLKLLLGMDTWVFLKLIWKTFVSLLNFGMPPSEKRLCEIWIRVTHLFFIPYLICTNLDKCGKCKCFLKTAQNIRSKDNSIFSYASSSTPHPRQWVSDSFGLA